MYKYGIPELGLQLIKEQNQIQVDYKLALF